MKRIGIPITRSASGLLPGVALLLASFTLGSTPAFAQFIGPVPLTLVNGWTNAPFVTSRTTVEEVNGIVQFRGAIASGTAAVAFTLPAALRPLTDVYVPVDLCNATNGRLHITSSGVADVEAEGGTFSNAQCFTSLDFNDDKPLLSFEKYASNSPSSATAPKVSFRSLLD